MSRVPILVQKFGGTSVATADRRQLVVGHVRRARAEGRQVALVVSAMGRRGDPYATDTLLDLLKAAGGDVDPADYDLMFSCGEAIAAALVSHTLKREGIPSVALTSAQAHIFTDGHHVEAEITGVDTARLHAAMAADQVPVVTGGQGVAPRTLDFTTLGRGGSDTSGVALGVALHADRVDIFTDVEGVATIDPRLVPGARLLGAVSYAAMYELARFGAKVVHPRALLAGWKGGTTVAVRSTFSEAPGTLVSDAPDEEPLVGVAVLAGLRTLSLPAGSVGPDRLEEWERRRVIVHVCDARTGNILVGAAPDKLPELRKAVTEAGVTPIGTETECGWVSLVGATDAVREQAGISLANLGQRAIDLVGHEVAERRCTFVVPDPLRDDAARAVHASAFDRASS
jgi:aspartate kinase